MTDFTDPNFIESKGDSLIKRRLRTKKVFSKAPIPSDTENDANKILSMLFDLEKGLSSAEKKSVTDELLRWARSLGSGTPENRGVEYKRVKAAFDESNEIKKSFVTALNSSSAETRSWSAAFIRQLFDKDEAVNLILSALSNESNSNAASWLSLSLSRLERDNPQICEAIAAAYKKFMGKFSADIQIARAWGYAGCQDAAPFLAQHLKNGGLDQKNIALDGLLSLGNIENLELQQVVTKVMLDSQQDFVRSQCIKVIKKFSSNSPETIKLLEEAVNGNDEEKSRFAEKVLDEIGHDPWKETTDHQDFWEEAKDTDSELLEAAEYIPKFTSDRPFGDDAVDCINIENEAKAFAKIAAAKDVDPPLAIGVFGEWGSGKTFFMERIHAHVDHLAGPNSHDGNEYPFFRRIVQIRFNAWHYMESNLWASLVDYIFQELDLWLHRKDEQQSDINALFDRLSTARQLKLESIQTVVEARKERKRAAVRLDNARKEYESALVRKSAYSSKTFWNAVLNTFKSQLNTDEEKAIKNAVNRLGLPQLADSAESLNATIEEAASQAGRAKVLFRTTFSKLGQKGAILSFIVLLVIVPTCLLALRSFLASIENLQWIENINELTLGLAGILTAITSVVGIVSNRTAQALDTIQTFHDKLGEAIDAETRKPKKDFASSQRDVAARQAELEQAEQNLANADKRVETAVQDWTASTPRGRLNRFIREKVIGGDYAKHLGIVAAIRKDFGQLAQMVSEGSADKSSRQLYEKAQEEYKTEINRIIAEASGALNKKEIDDLQKSASERVPALPSFERIILYIDDLDRCPPDKVVSVLQAIHLLLCFKLFVVVVAVDARWISRALIKQYPELLEENVMWVQPKQNIGESASKRSIRVGASSHDYLEKIFQIPYWVRPMGTKECTDYVEHLTKKDRISAQAGKSDHEPKADIKEKPHGLEAFSAKQIDNIGASNEDVQEVAVSLAQQTENETASDPGTIIKDIVHKRDSFAGMNITDYEIEMLKNLAPFAGSSPRRGLRFVNVYRLIKTSLDMKQLINLVGKEGEKLDYRAIITQLAISTGAPMIAQFYFQIIITADGRIKCIEDLIYKLNAESRIKLSQEWPMLFGALTTLWESNEDMELDVGVEMINALRNYAPIARRYSFTARPA